MSSYDVREATKKSLIFMIGFHQKVKIFLWLINKVQALVKVPVAYSQCRKAAVMPKKGWGEGTEKHNPQLTNQNLDCCKLSIPKEVLIKT